MKVGDLVTWIGLPNAKYPDEAIGVIVKVYNSNGGNQRYNVQWSDGKFGHLLYEQTIEVVNENR